MFIYSGNTDPVMVTHCLTASSAAGASRHLHESHELLLFLKGEVHYSINGERYALKPYDLLFIPSGTYHFLIPLADGPYENYVINFSTDFVREDLCARLFSPPYRLNIREDVRFKRMFALLDDYYERYSREDFAEAAGHLLKELLIYASYLPKAPVPIAEPGLIGSIASFVEQHLTEPLNAEIIAAQMNFSPCYIQNRFCREMGIGLYRYISQKKMFAARGDIRSGLSPLAASEKYGYANYSSFYRQYVKAFGHSPAEDAGEKDL